MDGVKNASFTLRNMDSGITQTSAPVSILNFIGAPFTLSNAYDWLVCLHGCLELL